MVQLHRITMYNLGKEPDMPEHPPFGFVPWYWPPRFPTV